MNEAKVTKKTDHSFLRPAFHINLSEINQEAQQGFVHPFLQDFFSNAPFTQQGFVQPFLQLLAPRLSASFEQQGFVQPFLQDFLCAAHLRAQAAGSFPSHFACLAAQAAFFFAEHLLPQAEAAEELSLLPLVVLHPLTNSPINRAEQTIKLFIIIFSFLFWITVISKLF